MGCATPRAAKVSCSDMQKVRADVKTTPDVQTSVYQGYVSAVLGSPSGSQAAVRHGLSVSFS